MSVNTDIPTSESLFGKSITDLQENVVVGDNTITGTLKYVTGYTGFSGDTSLQNGNFLALKMTSQIEGATIQVKLTNTVTLDSDGQIVLRIADKDTQKITVTVTKNGLTYATKTYSLTGLVCEDS